MYTHGLSIPYNSFSDLISSFDAIPVFFITNSKICNVFLKMCICPVLSHAAIETRYAASEGLVALLEPFIDTIVVCTMTALALIITGQIVVGAEIDDAQGVVLTANAMKGGISWFPYLLSFAVILFAFSSMISWSYYCYQAWSFLFGRGKILEYAYKTIFCVFVVIGAAASLGAVTDFSDAMIFSMLAPNMICLFLLLPKVKEELRRYKKPIAK